MQDRGGHLYHHDAMDAPAPPPCDHRHGHPPPREGDNGLRQGASGVQRGGGSTRGAGTGFGRQRCRTRPGAPSGNALRNRPLAGDGGIKQTKENRDDRGNSKQS